jgi:hypothetical protein
VPAPFVPPVPGPVEVGEAQAKKPTVERAAKERNRERVLA